MKNTHIVQSTSLRDIFREMARLNLGRAHFNNGTFTLPVDTYAPGFLAAFQCTLDQLKAAPYDALIVAINSDQSMLDSYWGKPDEAELIKKLIPEDKRASDLVDLMAAMYPDRQNVVIKYDNPTPEELYRNMRRTFPSLGASLHKLGFGTNPKDRPIIGGKYFDHLLAYPFHFDAKPVMHADTRERLPEDRDPDAVEKLTEIIGPHGQPYITSDGKLLFPVPPALQQFAAPRQGPAGGAKPEPGL